ncbi:MAG: molybdenum cofactor guanylyltransferase, partial [Planctomycetota bacterium]
MFPEFSVAILAGGRSRRMGGTDKLMLDIGGKPLLGRVLERLAPVTAIASETFLVAKEHEKYEAFGIPIVLDSRETGGAI